MSDNVIGILFQASESGDDAKFQKEKEKFYTHLNYRLYKNREADINWMFLLSFKNVCFKKFTSLSDEQKRLIELRNSIVYEAASKYNIRYYHNPQNIQIGDYISVKEGKETLNLYKVLKVIDSTHYLIRDAYLETSEFEKKINLRNFVVGVHPPYWSRFYPEKCKFFIINI